MLAHSICGAHWWCTHLRLLSPHPCLPNSHTICILYYTCGPIMTWRNEPKKCKTRLKCRRFIFTRELKDEFTNWWYKDQLVIFKGCLPQGFCTVRFPSSSIMGPPPITELVWYWDGHSSNQRPVGLQLCQKPLWTQQPFPETFKHWRGG